MKVLLMGEYSGFFSNLKNGLLELGIDCKLASNCDDWKKIDGADFPLINTNYGNIFKKIYNVVFEPIIHSKRFYGYDIVFLVNPTVFYKLINFLMIRKIKRHTNRLLVSIAGDCTPVYDSYLMGELGYYIYDNNPDLCKKYKDKKYKMMERKVLDISDGIIPIMYEYAVGVRERSNCLRTIPLPFNINSVRYTPNVVKNGKIVIAHGIIREECKGSSYIIKAMNIIKERHPDEVEIVIDGRMPLQDYLKWLNGANILIDQCKEHCYGMNALFAMARGCIVLGGASASSLAEFGLNECPVVHIEPMINQIVDKLEWVISQKSNFEQMGKAAHDFVAEFHDYKKIAQMYLDEWEEIK